MSINRFFQIISGFFLFSFVFDFLFRNSGFYVGYSFLLGLSIFAAIVLLASKKKIKVPQYLIYYLLFYLYATIMITIKQEFSLKGMIKAFVFSKHLKAFFIIFIVENTMFDKRSVAKYRGILKAVVYASVIFTAIQLLFPSQFVRFYSRYLGGGYEYIFGQRGFLRSIFGWVGSNVGDISLIAFIALSAGLEMYYKKKANTYVLLAFLFLSVYVVLVQARFLMLLAALIMLFLIVTHNKRIINYWKWLFGISAIMVLGYWVLKYFGFDLLYFYQNRFLSESGATRILAFEAFGREFPKSPIFGTGGIIEDSVHDFLAGRSSQIHVGYLSLFYYYGVIGGILFLLATLYLLKQLLGQARETGYWGAAVFYIAFLLSVDTTLVLLHWNLPGIYVTIMISRAMTHSTDSIIKRNTE